MLAVVRLTFNTRRGKRRRRGFSRPYLAACRVVYYLSSVCLPAGYISRHVGACIISLKSASIQDISCDMQGLVLSLFSLPPCRIYLEACRSVHYCTSVCLHAGYILRHAGAYIISLVTASRFRSPDKGLQNWSWGPCFSLCISHCITRDLFGKCAQIHNTVPARALSQA